MSKDIKVGDFVVVDGILNQYESVVEGKYAYIKDGRGLHVIEVSEIEPTTEATHLSVIVINSGVNLIIPIERVITEQEIKERNVRNFNLSQLSQSVMLKEECKMIQQLSREQD
jgi:hypothetical protein